MVRFIKKNLWRSRHPAFQLAAYHSGRYEPSKRAKRCRVRFTGLSGGAQRRARRRASVLAHGVCCGSSEGKTEYGRGSFSCRHATLHRSVLADVTGPLCVRGENVWVLRGPENLGSWHGLEGTRVLRWNRRAEKRVSRIFLRCPRRLPGANRLRGDVRGLDGGPSQDYDVSAAIAPDCVSWKGTFSAICALGGFRDALARLPSRSTEGTTAEAENVPSSGARRRCTAPGMARFGCPKPVGRTSRSVPLRLGQRAGGAPAAHCRAHPYGCAGTCRVADCVRPGAD